MQGKKEIKYYMMDSDQVLVDLEVGHDGLSQVEAGARLDKYGKNELKEKESNPTWKIFLESF